MPYPVPPPEPPSLVAPSRLEPAVPSTLETVRSFKYLQSRSGNALLASATALAKPSPPETLPPELADLREPSDLQGAAALGGTVTTEDEPILAQPPALPDTPAPPTNAPPAPIAPAAPPPVAPPPTVTPAPAPIPVQKLGSEGILELKADRQDYDVQRQIFTAEGRVSLKFRGALITGDRFQVNLVNRLTIAEGNVVLTRGDQTLRGQRFRYNLIQEEGTIEQAGGEIFLPTTATDFNPNLPTDVTSGTVPGGTVGDRVFANQPQQVTSPGSANLILGSGRNPSGAQVVPRIGGQVRRLRFEADQIEFYPEGWRAKKVRITNDPFSPPELELRAEEAQLRRLSPLRDEVVASRPRVVFDRGFSLPLLRNRVILDRNERQPALFNFGFDATDRGGLFIERQIDVLPPGAARFTITPQILVQKAITNGGNPFRPENFGVKSRLTVPLSPRTLVRGTAVLTSLDLGDVEDNLRASLRAQQLVGTHTLSLEASYRDRLFNNSLGFQDIQSSIGALFFSPNIVLGNTGINLSYQAGYQFVNADTDRADLLEPVRKNNRISLGRFQGSAAINRGFILWQGKAAPATPEAGLRYSPTPITPYLSLGLGLTGVGNAYSNGDYQRNLNATVGISGQIGNFTKPFLDYTAFNITYTQVLRDGLSPFLFDRVADDRILYAGITQQIYGPIRFGFQTAYNIQTGREISTDYVLEYSRRSYSVSVRYNPILELGSIGLRISDFNWSGGSEPFEGSGVSPVQGGVQRLPE
ncbi:DUF3769 domain-containing protein [Phormidesmis sp. 146-12]